MQDITKALFDWNPWLEGQFPAELAGIPRDIDLITYLDYKEIKIVEGARRVGKSTLLYQVIQHTLKNTDKLVYINFQDEILQKYTLSEVYHAFLQVRDIDYLFIDEIQDCKQWVQFVRKLYDTRQIKQIYISGSNSSLIRQEFAKLLTGRSITIKVKPLTFKEFLRFKDVAYTHISSRQEARIKKYFDLFMEEGGFPEVVTRASGQRELLINYFEDFLYKDIVTRYQVNATKLKELAIYIATNIGKLVSYRNMAKALSISSLTVQDYVNYLKETYLLFEIYRYDPSLKRQYSSNKKPYFLDVGIANTVSFRFSEDKGRILENIVYNYLSEVYFFQVGGECDFVVKDGLKIAQAIQVCYDLNDDNEKREVAGLVEACTTHRLKEGLLLTYDQDDELSQGGVKIVVKPVWKWLLE